MTRSEFRAAAAKHVALMVLVGAGFNLSMPLLWKTVCETPLGVICFPLHLFLMFVGVPILVAGSAILLVRAVHKRTTTLGLSGAWTAAVAAWLTGGALLLGFFTWFAQKGMTSRSLALAVVLAFAVVFVAFLAFAGPSAMNGRRADRRAAAHLARLAAGLVTILVGLPIALGAAGLLTFLPWVGSVFKVVLDPFLGALRAMGPPSAPLVWTCWIAFALFSAALAYLIVTQRHEGASDGSDAAFPVGGTRSTFGQRGG